MMKASRPETNIPKPQDLVDKSKSDTHFQKYQGADRNFPHSDLPVHLTWVKTDKHPFASYPLEVTLGSLALYDLHV